MIRVTPNTGRYAVDAIGLAAWLFLWIYAGWIVAVCVLVMMWANNVGLDIARAVEADNKRKLKAAIAQAAADFRGRALGALRKDAEAGSAAPGGVGNPNTNTEAEVAGEERP